MAGDLPDDETAYGFEVIWDGLRALVYGEGGRVRVQGPAGDDLSPSVPELARLGRALGSHEVVLDGELVAPGSDGQPDRERLKRRLAGAESEAAGRRLAGQVPLAYMAYDLLYLDGRSTLARPYTERRARLGELELAGPNWQAPSHHVGDGGALLELARQRGLRGVVAKRLESPYQPGARSPDWIEVRIG